ncbi:uncharacterized protein LOC111801704 [Cucurbita pepo subsp. pepo]|uniref:uncharacterized protein LOC111801704 n=1 Tax=Cucurbita pepo subsp. pepo TaxID=3664 RepID=UPI000C9D6700|nr:uncharacterized protein LOC111801704 [Cucurbita pepo subsp. pepo]
MASDSTFWLPPHFLSDHHTLPGKPISALHSPLQSDLLNDDDQEDFLAGLTQRLTHSTLRDRHKLVSLHEFEAKTGSPQSTLSGFGSWSAWSSVSSDGSPNGPSQAPSPPVTPFGSDDNTWDLIYAAAKQVARLKVNSSRDGVIGPSQSSSNLVSSVKDVGFYSHASQFGTELPIRKPESSVNWGRQVKAEKQRIHCGGGDFHHENGRIVVRPVDFSQSTWSSMQRNHQRNPSQSCAPAVPSTFHGGGSAPKKECAGTGVFLPRRYDNNPPQPRKRADYGSIAMLPRRNVQDMNRSVPQMTSNRRSQEAIMAQRNAIFAEQRLSYSRPAERGKSYEFLLPQEWTY